MRLIVACSIALASVLSACASPNEAPSPTDLPLSVGNGTGSQYGNYGAQAAGEMRDPSGERCFLFNWDRPLAKDRVVRVTSASCESREHPNWMVAREVSRTVLPMSESRLKDEAEDLRR